MTRDASPEHGTTLPVRVHLADLEGDLEHLVRLDADGCYLTEDRGRPTDALTALLTVCLMTVLAVAMTLAGVAWPITVITTLTLMYAAAFSIDTGLRHHRRRIRRVASPITDLITAVPREDRSWYLRTYAGMTRAGVPDGNAGSTTDDDAAVMTVHSELGDYRLGSVTDLLGRAMERCSALLGPDVPDEISDQARRIALILPDAVKYDRLDAEIGELDALADRLAVIRQHEIQIKQAREIKVQAHQEAENAALFDAARRGVGLDPIENRKDTP